MDAAAAAETPFRPESIPERSRAGISTEKKKNAPFILKRSILESENLNKNQVFWNESKLD